MSVLFIVGPKMHVGCTACCPLVSHDEYADGTDTQTDGRTPDRYIMFSALPFPTNLMPQVKQQVGCMCICQHYNI